MARLYANENVAFPVVEELRRRGHDAVTVAETGKANQKMSDDQVLEFAISDERAVLTFNRKHLFRPHRQRPDHQGIVSFPVGGAVSGAHALQAAGARPAWG